MVIKSIEETSYTGMFKISTEEGSVFFARQNYLPSIDINSILVGNEFCAEKEDELLDAGLASAVELKAVEYLARAEQCRFKLTAKLVQKNYERQYINMALDFLEQKNYLSDERFARAWLNTRKINHFEGRSKLLAELMSRGIDRDVALDAVNAFFEENDEGEMCRRAYIRFKEKGKTEEKLVASLMQAGFSYKLIKEAAQNEE